MTKYITLIAYKLYEDYYSTKNFIFNEPNFNDLSYLDQCFWKNLVGTIESYIIHNRGICECGKLNK